jgi:hypothetical protein
MHPYQQTGYCPFCPYVRLKILVARGEEYIENSEQSGREQRAPIASLIGNVFVLCPLFICSFYSILPVDYD